LPQYRSETAKEPSELVGGGMLETGGKLMGAGAEHMLKAAPKATRFVLKRVAGAPGYAYDITNVLTAKDRTRALFGLAGEAAGGFAGGALGAAAGGVAAPIGAVLGSAAGDELATEFYDDHQAAIRRAQDATSQWIAQRQADVRRKLGL